LESLRVVGPDGPRPFMRGILVQSLVSRGVPFEVALETATRVRERIVEQGEVEPDELRKLVDELLPAEYELEPPPRRSLGLDPPRVKSQRGTSTPFSKGMLSVSLQGAGLDPTDAYQVSQELETRLLQSGATEIGRAALRDLVADTIERSHGSRAVARYRVWRATFEDPKPLFVLLGGSSGAGKTTVAVEVARRLEISRVIGTDSIRQIMRLMFSKDLMPEIHCSTYDAYQILERDPGGGPSDFRARLLAGYREQAQKIAVGVQALLDRALEENASMLIEGANLLPGTLDLDRYRDRAHVIFIVMASLDAEQYRAHFTTRAVREQQRAPDRYLPHFDAILAIQDHILAQAELYELPIIDNVQLDETILAVVRSVIGTLKKSAQASP
jgi:2-phosphoglycerate kinase